MIPLGRFKGLGNQGLFMATPPLSAEQVATRAKPVTANGKRKGRPTNVERADHMVEAGLMPVSYMLGVLRDKSQSDQRRMWAAVNAAPYCHAKLNAIDMRTYVELQARLEGADARVVAPTKLSPAEREAMRTMILRALGDEGDAALSGGNGGDVIEGSYTTRDAQGGD